MLEDAFARLEAQVKAVERTVMLFEIVDDGETLQVVLEAAVVSHAFVERILPGMAERRVSEIVCQRNRLDEIFVHAQIARDRTRDLRDFETMREPCAKQIALVIHEDLGLVLEPSESGRMNDAVAIPLKFCARARRGFVMAPAARLGRMRGIWREVRFERGDGGQRYDAGNGRDRSGVE